MCLCAKPLHLCLFATQWTIACQSPLSMGFSRSEYWSGTSDCGERRQELIWTKLLRWPDKTQLPARPQLWPQLWPYEAMAKVSVLNMVVLKNPSLFHSPFWLRDQLREQWGPGRLPGVEERLYWLSWELIWSNPRLCWSVLSRQGDTCSSFRQMPPTHPSSSSLIAWEWPWSSSPAATTDRSSSESATTSTVGTSAASCARTHPWSHTSFSSGGTSWPQIPWWTAPTSTGTTTRTGWRP